MKHETVGATLSCGDTLANNEQSRKQQKAKGKKNKGKINLIQV